jgi:pyruvate/oxaloacetate carboxyltransferase
MIYAESKVHSVAFFAGYAAQLASMGADSICVCDPECLLTAQKVSELVTAIKGVVDIPLAISSVSEDVAKSASDAGAEIIVICENNSLVYTSELADEISLIRSEVGLVPLASPVSEIIKSQAELNLLANKRYESVTNEFKALVKGCYGRTSVPIEQSFISSICGNEPLVLVRPADMIPPELNDIREKCAPWYEQEEDIITLAICGDEAIGFFELRKARKYSLDIPHANSKLGIHVI